MSNGLSFEVRGIPAPQGSKSFRGMHGGKPVMTESGGQKLKDWRTAVRVDCVDAMRAAGVTGWSDTVAVHITFLMPRPKSHYRTGKHANELRPLAPIWCGKRPDIDKLIRATLDALTAAGIYADDANVAELAVGKRYANGHPGALIMVRPL